MRLIKRILFLLPVVLLVFASACTVNEKKARELINSTANVNFANISAFSAVTLITTQKLKGDGEFATFTENVEMHIAKSGGYTNVHLYAFRNNGNFSASATQAESEAFFRESNFYLYSDRFFSHVVYADLPLTEGNIYMTYPDFRQNTQLKFENILKVFDPKSYDAVEPKDAEGGGTEILVTINPARYDDLFRFISTNAYGTWEFMSDVNQVFEVITDVKMSFTVKGKNLLSREVTFTGRNHYDFVEDSTIMTYRTDYSYKNVSPQTPPSEIFGNI